MTAEERMMWVERYSALPTGNVADAMDGLGLKRGSVLGLHPIDPSQKRAAGFARTILQKRRSTPWDGVNLAKHGKVIDDKTEPGDLLVISMGGIMDVSTGGDLLALRAQLRGVQGELTDGCLRGLGQQTRCMAINVFDATLGVVLVWVLLPRFGLAGYIFILYFNECVNFTLSFTLLLRTVHRSCTDEKPPAG